MKEITDEKYRNIEMKVTTPTEREVVMTRVFDAPRRLVFDALTKPELFKRWFGPRGWSLVVCEIDLKVGGAWRSVLRGPGRQGHGDARRLPGNRAARAPRQHRVVRRLPGRVAQHAGPLREGWQDDVHNHGAVSVAGDS